MLCLFEIIILIINGYYFLFNILAYSFTAKVIVEVNVTGNNITYGYINIVIEVC